MEQMREKDKKKTRTDSFITMPDSFITRICSLGRNTRLPLGKSNAAAGSCPAASDRFHLLTMEAV